MPLFNTQFSYSNSRSKIVFIKVYLTFPIQITCLRCFKNSSVSNCLAAVINSASIVLHTMHRVFLTFYNMKKGFFTTMLLTKLFLLVRSPWKTVLFQSASYDINLIGTEQTKNQCGTHRYWTTPTYCSLRLL